MYKSNTLMQEACCTPEPSRQPTNEEIEAGAKAFYEALKPDSYPQWDSDCALRAEYYDASADSQSRQCKERQRKNESFR